jgi:hypothetical protein
MPRQIVLPSHFLHDGINELDVQITNHPEFRGTIPLYPAPLAPIRQIGILGGIRIEKCGREAILSCSLLPNSAEHSISIRARIVSVSSSALPILLYAKLLDPKSGSQIGYAETSNSALKPGVESEVDLRLNVQNEVRWSNQDPAVQSIVVSLASDSGTVDVQTQQTSLRDLGIREKHFFLLNDALTTFRGVYYVESRGSALPDAHAAIDRDLQLIGSLGANSIRITAAPSEYLLDRCDALGVMVLLELPIAGAPGHLLDDDYLKRAKALASDYLSAYGGHPSVVAIGLGSDNDDMDSRTQKFYSELSQYCKSQDAPVAHWYYFTSRFASVPFALDFAALSTFGIQNPALSHTALENFARVHQNAQPIMLTSGGMLVGSAEVGDSLGSAQYVAAQSQAIYSEHQALAQLGFQGQIVAPLRDYQSDFPVLFAQCRDNFQVSGGLLTESGKLRPAFAMVQALFQGQKSPATGTPEVSKPSTVPFLLFALILAFLFLLLLNMDRRFREYVNRALLRPFNFFADIRDQRLIPNAQSILLGGIVAGSWGVVLAGLLFTFRENYTAAWILRMLVHPRGFTALLCSWAWSPWTLLLVATAIPFAVLFLMAGVIRFAAIFVRQRIFFTDTLSVAVWALMPSILLLPLGMILPRLEPVAMTFDVTLVVLILMKLWLLYRIMKGIGVLFDVYPTRIYLYCGSGIAILYFLILMFMNYRYALFSNWDFVLHLAKT